MRKFYTVTIVLLILLFAGQAMAGGYAVSGVGLRALSMGGAFRAVADDWSAAFYNPAGLAYLYENQFAAGMDFYSNRAKFTPEVTLNDYSIGYLDGEERVPNDKIAYTGFASGMFLVPILQDITVGLAVFQPYDYVSEWDIFRLSPAYNEHVDDTITYPVVEPMVIFPDHQYKMNLDVIDFHPTVAAELIEDKFAMGLGLSIRKGDWHSTQLVMVPNELGNIYNARPYDFLVTTTEYEAAGWGIGFNIGMIYHLNDRLTFGASYQSKTTIDLSGDAIGTLYAPGNRHLVVYADTGSVEQELYQGNTYSATHDADIEWTLPGELGFGLKYMFNDNVKGAIDFVYTFWSEYEDMEFEVNSTSGTTTFSFINGLLMPQGMINNWDDAFRVAAGLEGKINERWTLRGGYSYDQSPIPDENAMIFWNNPGDRHHLTGGVSLFAGVFELTGAAQLVFVPETDVASLNDYNDDGIFDNLSGAYNNVLFVTSIGFTVRF